MTVHINKYAGHPRLPGFDNCNDCSKEAYLWEKYLKNAAKYDPKNKSQPPYIINLIDGLNLVNLPLITKDAPHGYLLNGFTDEHLNFIYKGRNRIYIERKKRFVHGRVVN